MAKGALALFQWGLLHCYTPKRHGCNNSRAKTRIGRLEKVLETGEDCARLELVYFTSIYCKYCQDNIVASLKITPEAFSELY